ncbi:MAG: Ig-like domain-containing protein, partial [Fuerstiella sp.]|nr:Ig-like domain-containing protein [Fuerstiella sp.]
DGTTVITSDGGTVEGPEDTGISAVVPRGALPDGTPVRVDSMTGYDLEAAGAKGLEFKGGVFLDIPDGITAEKEITLSVPLPDISDLTENNLLVFTEIIFFGQPRIMLISAGNIETWETGRKRRGDYSYGMTCGTVSKGPHMFFKAMYPQKMTIYTPSPMMGPIMIDIKSQDYGDVFADPLYFKTSPICFVPAENPFDITVLSTDTGQTLDELPDNYIGNASQFFIPDPANKGQEIGIYPWPGDGDTNIPVNSSVRIDFSFDVVVSSLTLTEVSKEGDFLVPGTETPTASGNQITFTPERRLKYGTLYRADLNISPNNGFSPPPQSESLSYTTAHVRVTGSPETNFQCFPSDIAILSKGCEVAVANGTLSPGTAENTGFHKNSHGVLIFDYS